MTFDLDSILNIVSIAGQVIGAASVVAAALPQNSKMSQAVPVLKTARQVVDVLALNLGNAKNAPPKS